MLDEKRNKDMKKEILDITQRLKEYFISDLKLSNELSIFLCGGNGVTGSDLKMRND